MVKKEKKEIKKLLLGRTVLDEEGRLVTPEAGTIRVPTGIADGAGAVRFLGVSGRVRCYESDLSGEELVEHVKGCMANLGRSVRLRQRPEAVACLIRYVLTKPVILSFRFVEGRGILTAWTGRGLTCRLSQNRAIRAFENPLADLLRISAEPPPEDETEEKGRRQRKKSPPKKSGKGPVNEDGYDDEYSDGYSDGDAEEYGEEYAEEYAEEYNEEYSEEYGEEYNEEYGAKYDEYGETGEMEDRKE